MAIAKIQNRNATSPNALAKMARLRKVVELRKTGMDLDDIAAAIHRLADSGELSWVPEAYGKQTVHSDIKAAMDEASTMLAFDCSQLREMEMQRANAGYAVAWSIVEDPKSSRSDRLFALDRCDKFQKRIADLGGLDSPKKIAATDGAGRFVGTDGNDDRLRRLQALIDAASARPAAPKDDAAGDGADPSLAAGDSDEADGEAGAAEFGPGGEN